MTILVDPVTLQSVSIPDCVANTYITKGFLFPDHPTVAGLFQPQEIPAAKNKAGLDINTCSVKQLENLIGNLAIAKRAVANRPYEALSDLQNKIPDFGWDAYQASFIYD